MTAAHNTLPLNSIVRVVNLESNQSTVVRITDRGPFVGDRIIDLSLAAAKAVNVYLSRHRAGPPRGPGSSAPHRNRWPLVRADRRISVAIRRAPRETATAATATPAAQVLQFKGPTGYWVRIRIAKDDKEKTREVYQHTHVDEGAVFMVRLD